MEIKTKIRVTIKYIYTFLKFPNKYPLTLYQLYLKILLVYILRDRLNDITIRIHYVVCVYIYSHLYYIIFSI